MSKVNGLKFSSHVAVAAAMLGVSLFAPTVYAQSGRGGEQSFSGQINESSPREDGRRYQVKTMVLEAGKRYAISANSDAFDTKIRLSFADDNDEPLGEDDDGGEGTNSYIEFIPARSGTHRLRVISFNDEGGRYTLSVKSLPPLPALLRPTANGSSRIEFRHYSGELTSGDAVVHGRRVDDYVFRFEAGKSAFIYMDRKDEGIDPHLSVFSVKDRNGNNVIASDDDGGQDMNAFLNFIPEQSGDYIVRASNVGDEASVGKYELRVGQQP